MALYWEGPISVLLLKVFWFSKVPRLVERDKTTARSSCLTEDIVIHLKNCSKIKRWWHHIGKPLEKLKSYMRIRQDEAGLLSECIRYKGILVLAPSWLQANQSEVEFEAVVFSCHWQLIHYLIQVLGTSVGMWESSGKSMESWLLLGKIVFASAWRELPKWWWESWGSPGSGTKMGLKIRGLMVSSFFPGGEWGHWKCNFLSTLSVCLLVWLPFCFLSCLFIMVLTLVVTIWCVRYCTKHTTFVEWVNYIHMPSGLGYVSVGLWRKRTVAMIWKATPSVTIVNTMSKHDTVLGAVGNQLQRHKVCPWVYKHPNAGWCI